MSRLRILGLDDAQDIRDYLIDCFEEWTCGYRAISRWVSTHINMMEKAVTGGRELSGDFKPAFEASEKINILTEAGFALDCKT